MKKLSPNLSVKDVKKSMEFYKELGFSEGMVVPDKENPQWASLVCNGVEIMLQEKSNIEKEFPQLEKKEIGGTFTMFIETDKIQELYKICKDNNFNIIKEMEKTFYGADEFSVMDLDNYILSFSQH